MNKLAGALVVLVGLFPLVTRIPFMNTSVVQAYILGPLVLFFFLVSFGVSLWITTEEMILGLLACWYSVQMLWNFSHYGIETIQEVVFGLALVMVARNWFDRQFFIRVMEVVGCLEAALVVVQFFGADLTWDGLVSVGYRPSGTFGNRSYVAAFLAMLIPVASPIATGIMVLGLVCTKSITACIAASIGLMVRWPQARLTVLGTGAVLTGFAFFQHSAWWVSLVSRLRVWEMAASVMDLKAFLIGHGPGMWFKLIPQLQLIHQVELREGAFGFAHNDLIQMFFDVGVVGFGLIIWWLVKNQRFFLDPQRASLITIFIVSMMMFPFHLATVGVPAACLVGVLTKEEEV